MVSPKFLKFNTLSLHAGQEPDPKTGSRATPIHQTTSYLFDDTDHAAALYNLEQPDIYILEFQIQLFQFSKKD